MPEYKSQHYVPKCYLKNFTNNEMLFSVYNHKTEKFIDNVTYKTQCQKDYFYNPEWEEKLNKIETKWGKIFKKINCEDNLSIDEVKLLKIFSIYQYLRTKVEYNHSFEIEKESFREYYRMDCLSKKTPYTDSEFNASWDLLDKYSSPVEHLNNAEEFENEIDDLDLLIITYNTNTRLISSDSPVIMLNPFCKNVGFKTIGLVIFFAVSPDKLVVFYDSKIYSEFKNVLYFISYDEKEVKALNNIQYIMSEDIIYGINSNYFNYVKGLKSKREQQQSKAKINSLGSDTNKIIHQVPRQVSYDYNFSFAKFSSKLKEIPWQCRDALPREWSAEYEKRVRVILPNIPDIMNNYNSKDKKILKKGYEKMAKFALKYWGK